MRTLLGVGVLALALSGALATIAHADSINFRIGEVAIGYSDGYWDRDHRWHEWRREEDRRAYRAAKEAEYHEWKHDRYKDMGWHERH